MDEHTTKKVEINGNHTTVKLKQILELDHFALETFWDRLKWLFTGKVGTYIDDNGKIVKITNNK